MKYFLKIKYTSLVLLLLANTILTFFVPVYSFENVISASEVKKIPTINVELGGNQKSQFSDNKETFIYIEDETPSPTPSSTPIDESKIIITAPTPPPSAAPSATPNIQQIDIKDDLMLSAPDLIINDKKIILKRIPIYDGTYWLFPIEEIATELQDGLEVDLIEKIITVRRFRDRAVVRLNVGNGLVTINNNPFRILDGFQHIVLGSDEQLVPPNAIALLHGLSLKIDEKNNYIYKSVLSGLAEIQGTISPKSKESIRQLSLDYLNSNFSVNDIQSADFQTRRFEVNAGAHNDAFSLTSNLVLRAGTDTGPAYFDTGFLSYFKKDSPIEFFIGDRTLSALRSPFFAGILMRGIGLQTGGKLPDSKVLYGIGFIPSNNKILGRAESFFKYGRAVQFIEWTSSPKKMWQYSFGETVYKDTIDNVFINGKQTGGIVASNVTKTGKFIEGQANLAYSYADDKRYESVVPDGNSASSSGSILTNKTKSKLVEDQKSGIGTDVLIRLKPKEWFSVFGKGAYYAPGFYPITANNYYNDRNELTGGVNLGFKRASLGFSGTTGQLMLDQDKPDKYKIVNAFSNITPIKKGPLISVNYSKNLSQVSPNRSFFIFSNPIFQTNKNSILLDQLLERRTTSTFRIGLVQNFSMTNISANYNKIGLNTEKNISLPILGKDLNDNFTSIDFNINRVINDKLALLNFSQFSKQYDQFTLGARIGPILNKKLNLQAQCGLIKNKIETSALYNLNLNYIFNKKLSFSLIYEKSNFLERVFGLVRYNFVGDSNSGNPLIQPVVSKGKITGRVYIKPDDVSSLPPDKQAALIGKGVPNIRIYFSNYTYTTDKNGYYVIDNVSPGTHRITVDFSDIPAYLASLSNESIDVNVERGKETTYDFILSYYGSAKGKVVLIGENPDLNDTQPTSINGLRIYLKDTDHETLTDEFGDFSIEDVKPGKYNILVDPDFLPSNLDVVNSVYEIEIKAKQKVENIELKIKYKDRNIEEREF